MVETNSKTRPSEPGPIDLRLKRYEALVGSLESVFELASYIGVVQSLDDGEGTAARVLLTDADGERVVRLFPMNRLEAAGAAFAGAKIRYRLFRNGDANISRLEYVGPSREELLSQPMFRISDEELEALEG